MNLFSLLRKPAWEHKDAARRAAAIAGEDHPDLIARLPELARTDPEPAARLAAVRRIDDLSLLGDRSRNDDDAAVREAARQRFVQRLLDARLPEAERERVLDRFVRLPDAPASGSGLGLAIVRAVADLHAATLRLDASPTLGGLRVRVGFARADGPSAQG